VAEIPEKSLDLFQKKASAQLATLMRDGSPQVTTVWVDYDGRYILTNTVKGHVKDRNMRRDPRVGLDIVDPENPYRHLSVRGRIVDITEQGADAYIDKLTKKYFGQEKYSRRSPGEARVIYKVESERAYMRSSAAEHRRSHAG
jgi:PPOX class probable F420-dependent enzyme